VTRPDSGTEIGSSRDYCGGELELFALAANWKRYVARTCAPFLRGHVLEVGAGLGATTRSLFPGRGSVREWTAIEPDPNLLAALERTANELAAARAVPVRARGGVLADLPDEARFDAILYIDVLEHIADDRSELAGAVRRLLPGGHVVVLAPAHGALYSEFDAQVGHHRRYDKRSLRSLGPAGGRLVTLRYLDSVGLLASLGNRVLLRRSLPTRRQIRVWDGLMIPASRVLDRLSFGVLGKSILAVWRR
jgi:SAM-dependent methyltransferase